MRISSCIMRPDESAQIDGEPDGLGVLRATQPSSATAICPPEVAAGLHLTFSLLNNRRLSFYSSTNDIHCSCSHSEPYRHRSDLNLLSERGREERFPVTAEEFSRTAIQRKIDNLLVTDLRPFAGRQAEAADFYLREILAKLRSGQFPLAGQQSMAVWCDRGTCFLYSTLDCYRELWRARFPMTIDEKQKAYSHSASQLHVQHVVKL